MLRRFTLLIGIWFVCWFPVFTQTEPEITPETPLLDTIRAFFQSNDLSPLLGMPIELTITVEMPTTG